RHKISPRILETIDLAKADAQGATILATAWLEGVVAKTVIDIDPARLDAVLARIPDDLCRRIKTHRLRIQERAGEGVGIVAFEPGRDIDELGEGRGMAFRKTVFAKAFD